MKTFQLYTLLAFLSFNVLSAFSQNKEWKCIDEKGEVAFTIEARSVSEYSNDLAKIKDHQIINTQWETSHGYVNKVGEIVIPTIYDKAYDFVADVTWVKKKDSIYYTLIDKTGKTVPTKKYNKVGRFYKGIPGVSEGICAVYEKDKLGFIDVTGKEVIPCKYLGSTTFHDGLVCLTLYHEKDEKYGFLDETGKVVIPFQYKQAGPSNFKNGECRVSVDGKIAIINKKGEVIFKTQYYSLQNFNFGLAPVCTKSNRTGWGFVDKNDKWVVQPDYDNATPFNDDGFAIIEKKNLKGAIDSTGKIVLPLKYETIYIEPTKDGRICAVLPSKQEVSMYNAEKEYYDKDLNPISLDNVLFLSGAEGEKLMMYTSSNKKIGYMNRNFEIVIPAKYRKANPFSEGLAWVREK